MDEFWDWRISDMTKAYRGCFFHGGAGSMIWPDFVSRAQYYPIGLFEHIHLRNGGRRFWSEYRNLGVLGWNDRVSSLEILF